MSADSTWLAANDRIRLHPEAAMSIVRQYGRDWKTGRTTAVCAASLNTPLWQEAVARCYPESRDLFSLRTARDVVDGREGEG